MSVVAVNCDLILLALIKRSQILCFCKRVLKNICVFMLFLLYPGVILAAVMAGFVFVVVVYKCHLMRKTTFL